MADSGKKDKVVGGKVVQDRLLKAEREAATVVELPSQRLAKFPDALLKRKGLLDIQVLDLSNNILSALPAKFPKLTSLRVLRLSRNRFVEFPEVLFEVPTLQELYLDENQIPSIPPAINRLSSLALLNITHNRLSCLPKELGSLPALRRIELAGNPLPSYHEKLFLAYARQPNSLNLHGMDLDRVPDGIGLLNMCLTNLYLNSNHITRLSTELFELRFLREVDLRSNELEELPPLIAQLKNLRVLILSSNKLTSLPPQIAELQRLEHLAISSNRFTEFPAPVLNMPALQELFLAANEPGLEHIPDDITRIQTLRLLYVKDNRISRWTCDFSALPVLRKISFAGNPISELSVEPFMSCPALEGLELANTRLPIVQQKMIEGAVKKSPVLDLSEVDADVLTDELVHFKDIITHLCFSNNQLQAVPPVMLQLGMLKMLDLSFNELCSLPEELSGGLPKLRELILHHNRFEEIPPGVVGLSRLRVLNLSQNRVSNIDADYSALPALRTLKLSGNEIADIAPGLFTVSSLRELDLSWNRIEHLPDDIGNLVDLEELYLDNNSLSVLPTTIGNIAGLHTLRVTNNRLTEVPEVLIDMNIILLSLGGNQLDPVLDELLALYTTRAGVLDLRAKVIGRIPAPVFKLAFIQELCLAENHISDLPPSLADMRLLWMLDISNNGFATLPPVLGELTKLRTLVASNNQITSIPWEALKNPQLSILHLACNNISSLELAGADQVLFPLEELILDDNDLAELPVVLYSLQKLRKISVSGNARMKSIHNVFCSAENRIHPLELSLAHQDLEDLPAELFSMTHLTALDISGNRFTTLPGGLDRLPELRRLDISTTLIGSIAATSQLQGLTELRATNCGIKEIPSEIYCLSNLQRLMLSFNDITAIPSDLGLLTSLKELHIANNKLEGLPSNLPVLDVLNVRRNVFNSGARSKTSYWAGSSPPTTPERCSSTGTMSKSSPALSTVHSVVQPLPDMSKSDSAPVSPKRPLPATPPVSKPISIAPVAIVLPEDIDAPIPARQPASGTVSPPSDKGGKAKINRKFSSGWKKLSKRARTWTDIGGAARSPPDAAKRPITTMSPRGNPGLGSIPRRTGLTVLVGLADTAGSLTPVTVEKKLFNMLVESIEQELGISEPIKQLEVRASPNWTLDSDKGVRNLEINDVIMIHL